MQDSHTPARKPPKWPKQSILTVLLEDQPAEGVNIRMKSIIMAAVHPIWHFIDFPIKSNPFQLIIIQPNITPIMPQRAVDAPAFTTADEEQTKLKILPLIPDARYMNKVYLKPNVYQILERNIKVVIRLPNRCMKQTCRNMAEIRRQTYPFKTLGWQFPPQSIKVDGLIPSRQYEFLKQLESWLNPMDTSKMNIAISTMQMRKVNDRKLNTGHKAQVSMSQYVQSLGSFTCFFPDTNSTLCSEAIHNCCLVTGSLIP